VSGLDRAILLDTPDTDQPAEPKGHWWRSGRKSA
jgi:hypothetical protein